MLNKRCFQIFSSIINNRSNPITVSKLSQMFNVSNRTISYTLDSIDNFLEINNLPLLSRKPNVGICYKCNDIQRQKIFELMKKLDDKLYIYTKEERLNIILCELIQQRDYITAKDLASKLNVSRSTIVKDLENVEKWLSVQNLKLFSNRGYGIKIVGEEKYLRKATNKLYMRNIDVYKALNDINPLSSIKMNVSIHNNMNKFFDDIDIPYIESCINITEKELDTFFSDEAYSALVMHIVIAIKRIQLEKAIVMPKDELIVLQTTKEFVAASNLAKMLEEYFRIKIPIDEIGYMTVHFLGSNSINTKESYSENWLDLQLITNEIIENVSKEYKFNKDEQLFIGLLEHIRPALYRIKHGLTLKNPLMDEIYINYRDLFEIVKKGIKPLKKYTNKKINDEEIGYLTLHFAASIEKYKNKNTLRPDVLIVCASGIGTSNLISSKIQSLFNINIIDIVSSHQVKDLIKGKKIDLIITTVPLNDVGIKWVRVSPFLTNKDILNLINSLNINTNKLLKADIKMNEIIEIVMKHCNIINCNDLINDLSSYFTLGNNDLLGGDVQPLLSDLLTEKTVQVGVDAIDWEESVKKGGELLKRNGCIEHEYIEAMINTVKEIGPYVVIVPGIAMPHARPESGVKKIGLSFITLKESVKFGHKENDPVRIVICLCAIDHSTHLKALSELVGLLGDQVFINLALSAKNKFEILKYINKREAK